MTEQRSVLHQFPRSFWIANVMEIMERMGWYGFYAVSTLYLTNAVADGGLGFTSEDRGFIQGISTFFLYLFPAVFGALADRYGYRRMFMASAVVMAPAYILLAAPRTFCWKSCATACKTQISRSGRPVRSRRPGASRPSSMTCLKNSPTGSRSARARKWARPTRRSRASCARPACRYASVAFT